MLLKKVIRAARPIKEGGGKRTPYQKWKIRKTLLYYYPLL